MEEYVSLDQICINCMKKKETAGICEHCGFDECGYQCSAHQLPPRYILNGKYMIGKVLGEGGFGITYLGYDLNLEIPLAIKEYFPSGFVGRETVHTASVYPYTKDATQFFETGKSKFIEEARKLAKFQNLASIVSVRDYFQENQTAYIVMEYLEGCDLKHYLLSHNGHLSQQAILTIMKPLIESLIKVHASGIIHRDISPDNIMVLADGSVKLIDFGAARNIDESGEQSKTVSVKNGYAPKEQYLSHGVQGPWTDVYALCATIYKCFSGITPIQSLERMGHDTLQPLHTLHISIDSHLEAVLMKGLSVEIEDRYQNMEELYDAMYMIEPVEDEDKTVYIPQEHFEKAASVVMKKSNSGKLNKKILYGIGAAAALLCVFLFLFQPWKSHEEPVRTAVKQKQQEVNNQSQETLVEKDHGTYMQEHFFVEDTRVYSYFNKSLLRTSKGTNSDLKIYLKDIGIDAFAVSGSYLYVILKEDHYLYCYNMQENTSTRISRDDMSKASVPLVYKDKLYYLMPQASNQNLRTIVCVDMRTQDYTILPDSKGYTNLAVEDDLLYYMAYDGAKTQIGSISLQNKQDSLICEKEGSPLVLAVDNARLFASYLDGNKETVIFMRNLSTHKETKILQSSRMIGGFAISDQHEYIYYLYLNSDMQQMKGMYRADIHNDEKQKAIYTSGDERMVAPYGSDKLYFPSAANYYVIRMDLDGGNQEHWITCKDKITDIEEVDEYLYVMTEKDIYWVKFTADKTKLGYSDTSTKTKNQNTSSFLQKIDTQYGAGEIKTIRKNEVAVPENQLQYKITSVSRSAANNSQKANVRVNLEVALSEARSTSMYLRKETFLIRTLSGNTVEQRNLMPVNMVYETKSKSFPMLLSPHKLYKLTLEFTIPADVSDYYFIMSNLDENLNSKGSLYVSHFKKSYASSTSSSASVSNEKDSAYILKNSGTAYLQKADVLALSDTELMLARNEIYARHGRKFKDVSIRSYFLKKSWYRPLYEVDDFDEKITLNAYEKANVQLILKQEANGNT